MTSAAAVIGLTYRGADVQDIDGIFLDLVGGLADPPEVRGVDTVIPSLDGQIARNRRAHRRSLRLRGFVRGSGDDEAEQRADYWDNLLAFNVVFDPALDPGDLVATLPNGLVATISARTLNWLPNEVVPTYRDVDVELESVDPDWVFEGS